MYYKNKTLLTTIFIILIACSVSTAQQRIGISAGYSFYTDQELEGNSISIEDGSALAINYLREINSFGDIYAGFGLSMYSYNDEFTEQYYLKYTDINQSMMKVDYGLDQTYSMRAGYNMSPFDDWPVEPSALIAVGLDYIVAGNHTVTAPPVITKNIAHDENEFGWEILLQLALTYDLNDTTELTANYNLVVPYGVNLYPSTNHPVMLGVRFGI